MLPLLFRDVGHNREQEILHSAETKNSYRGHQHTNQPLWGVLHSGGNAVNPQEGDALNDFSKTAAGGPQGVYGLSVSEKSQIQGLVGLCGVFPGKILFHPMADDGVPPLSITPVRKGSFDHPTEFARGVVAKEKTVSVGGAVHVDDGVREAADGADERNRSVTKGDKLREAAWFEKGRHEEHVAACVEKVRQRFVVPCMNMEEIWISASFFL